MASTFKSLPLFNSGPHRFSMRPIGEYVLRKAVVNPYAAGSQAIGPLELVILITGRLVAGTESALWTARDAISAQLTDPPQVGTLIDHHARTWTDMSFVEFAPADRTDKARAVSLAYEARFIRFLP